jgi:hypothetical protein
MDALCASLPSSSASRRTVLDGSRRQLRQDLICCTCDQKLHERLTQWQLQEEVGPLWGSWWFPDCQLKGPGPLPDAGIYNTAFRCDTATPSSAKSSCARPVSTPASSGCTSATLQRLSGHVSDFERRLWRRQRGRVKAEQRERTWPGLLHKCREHHTRGGHRHTNDRLGARLSCVIVRHLPCIARLYQRWLQQQEQERQAACEAAQV